MDPITMTAVELETLQQELRELETVGRREIAARIKTAREWGDLKENAEYHAAKEDQAHLETRIAKLRGQMRNADVVDVPGTADVVQHGSTVSYTDRESNNQRVVKLVSPHDASPAEGALSVASPVAKALIGRRPGDVIEVQTPRGVRTLSVDEVR
jgi:transcription elongation factor GreA